MPAYYKSLTVGKGSTSSGAEITPEILAKINQYALKELTAEELYARRFILAHNAVDRDRERFPEELLEDFSATLPGKSFLFAHRRGEYLPLGLFFDAVTEDLSPEKFKELTGEDPSLPEDIDQVRVLWAWMYMCKAGQEDFVRNMDAGIYRHVSIGFNAADLITIKGEFDQTLYWEYVPPGEATEGSIVWLGAQPGATVQKQSQMDGTQTRRNDNPLIPLENREIKAPLNRRGLNRIDDNPLIPEENREDFDAGAGKKTDAANPLIPTENL